MAVGFDFTTRLENVYQIITGSNPEWTSEILTNPSDGVFFLAQIAPGHTGTTSDIEFYLKWNFSLDVALASEFASSGSAFAGIVDLNGNDPAFITTADTQNVIAGDVIRDNDAGMSAEYLYVVSEVITNSKITVDCETYLVNSNFIEIVPHSLSWKWEIKPSGGAWTTLVAGTTTLPQNGGKLTLETIGHLDHYEWGIYEPDILLPAQIRLVGTDADAAWSATVGGTSYPAMIRAIGTV